MLTDVAIAAIPILILAASFCFAFCHDCITVRRHRSAQQRRTRPN